MSIGKVNASLMGGLTQETTMTLANLNFDFALCKIEAPTEYQGLGECLSTRHRAAAETGNEHILARKLGALFSHRLPATPKLVRAYGKRATETIREISNRNTESATRGGVFREWTGPDATSIWAAATSGTGAIAAHLLACMLARVWTASEAEAVWEEIIGERKLEIAQSDPGTAAWQSSELAAKIEVTKDQISRWDSSARSWLEIADKCRMKQQKQLELLVENAGIPVSQASTTYRSVMDAWTTALSTVEKLLEGVPQSINDGSVILALTSWHLYPDMFVVGAGPNIISQHDPLYPKGTVITLGQSSRPPDATSDGVFWSLPLACLKYYGDPVVRTRTLGESTSRLTFPEVMQVVLGCMLAGWGDYGRDVRQACVNVVSLAECLSRNEPKEPGNPRSWMQLLTESAESYLEEADSSQNHLRSLTLRGQRRYKHLLWDPKQEHPGPALFGLGSLNTVLHLIENMESKISFLRLAAQNLMNANHNNVLIRYRVHRTEEDPGSDFLNLMVEPDDEKEDDFSSFLDSDWTWEYATALGQRQQPLNKKRKLTAGGDLTGHKRWTSREGHFADTGEEYLEIEVPPVPMAHTSRSFQWEQHGSRALRSVQAQTSWVCILGNPDEAAIFKLSYVDLSGSEELGHRHIDEVLRSDWIDRAKLLQLIDLRGEFAHPRPPQYLECLRALAAAAEAYKLMPGATISTDLFSAPLKNALWMPGHSTERSAKLSRGDTDEIADARNSLMFGSAVDPRLLFRSETKDKSESPVREDTHDGLKFHTLSRNQVFSCIAMFENRKVNLDPHIMDQVMAISAGGSIYVAMPMVCDPFDSVGPNEIKHITGNISKPGLSLMIPPMAPKLKKVDEEKWTLINHAAFDGHLDDSFQHTSLHLSFTGYQLPMVTAEHGYQGIEANFVETLVSVFDGKEWVGDLDVLKAVAMPSVSRVSAHMLLKGCRHKKPRNTPQFALTSIDSWDEFMDRPSNACIFRASGNWLARLSAVAINVQQCLNTVVLEDGKQFCWECIGRMTGIQEEDAQKKLLFIG
ncbi:hypothetical protein Daus18300_013037 [Diaporthe australafricana]|uniref:Heterokaryon incompatibility domain-containing protein n=1 Tax=Diaporthe australafricana TaxID=127596 RepID=A0ABR3W0J2_9PEZI